MKLIKKIKIENFRSSVDISLDDISDLAIFAGANDSGKSNILRALNLFFNNKTSIEDYFDFRMDYSKYSLLSAREAAKKRQFISITVHFNLNGINTHTDLVNEAKKHDEGLWIKKTWWRDSGFPDEEFPVFLKNATGKRQLKASMRKLLNSIHFIYIPAFKNEEVFADVLRMAGDEENALLKTGEIKTLNDALKKATDDLTGDFKKISKISSKITLPTTLGNFWHNLEINTDFNEDLNSKKLKKGKVGDYNISIASRGEGIKSIFVPVMLNWLAKKQNKKYWIWGIDEPENSLEMMRVVNLFDEFYDNYSTSSQIFCSTHSPAFIFPDENKDRSIVYWVQINENMESEYKILNFKDGRGKKEISSIVGVDQYRFLSWQKESAEKMRALSGKLENTRKAFGDLKKEVEKNKEPLIITEGKSDWKIIKSAAKKLGRFKKGVFWEFQDDLSGGDTTIFKMLEEFRKVKQPKKMIFIFDRDHDDIVKKCQKDPFKDWGNNVYSFCIKKPKHRQFTEICIEHYFKDNELKAEDENKRRLFLGSEFTKNGISHNGKYYAMERNKCYKDKIIDQYVYEIKDSEGKNSLALSKDSFADNILKNIKGFDKFDFEEFNSVFDTIDAILVK